jgi:transcriptional regulator
MYIPKHFAAPSTEALYELIRSYPLATLVTQTANGLDANHLPLYLTRQEDGLGTLSGHIARANPLGQELLTIEDVLIIFHGPNAYITPSWYPIKIQHGMVVPTWNYVVVHAKGKLKLIDDAEWLHQHLELLTLQNEARFENAWQIQDAPASFIDKMIKAVIGIEIEITSLTGKWKASQNQSVENQLGVIQGLSEGNSVNNQAMASMISSANHLT